MRFNSPWIKLAMLVFASLMFCITSSCKNNTSKMDEYNLINALKIVLNKLNNNYSKVLILKKKRVENVEECDKYNCI